MARTEYGTTWWGKQWLEALGDIDYDNRIPRGKTYANTGRVLSFKIDSSRRVIKARVEGNYDPYYRVTIGLPPIRKYFQFAVSLGFAFSRDAGRIWSFLAAVLISPFLANIWLQ